MTTEDHVHPDCDIVGRDTGLAPVLDRIRRVLGVPVNVLVIGESGTGKELVARILHREDPHRRRRPMVALNCAALPEQLIEAELFGYLKGAFTGASEDRQGIFMQADGGTIFLDEVGELPLDVQPKLLRVLQERAIRRLGSGVEEPLDVRVVAATNRDLCRCVAEGTFREDLYYRLAEFVIDVPPLRRRRQDILPLALHFLQQYRGEFNRTHVRDLSPEAVDWLVTRDWSSNNVRELSAVVKRAVLFCDTATVDVDHLDEGASTGEPRLRQSGFAPHELQSALASSQGNVSAAARLLGMKRSTFFDHLRRYGIRQPTDPVVS